MQLFAEKLAGLILRHEAQDGFEQKAEVALLLRLRGVAVESGDEFVCTGGVWMDSAESSFRHAVSARRSGTPPSCLGTQCGEDEGTSFVCAKPLSSVRRRSARSAR